jgi:hypothetical protein
MVNTTTDLIKILPFNKDFKKDLLEKYDSLDPDTKFNIQTMLWNLYDGLFELKLNENLSIALEEAGNNQEKLDSNFYKRVRDLTDDEMSTVSAEDFKDLDLDIAREKLQEIISSKN